MQLRSLIQLTASVGAIGLLDRIVAVGLGIIFARWLGPNEFGTYAFVVTAIALLCIPAKLGIPELLTRDIAASRGSAEPLALGRSILKGFAVVGAASFAIVAVGQLVLQFTADTPISRLMKIGLWMVIPSAFFEVVAGIIRGLGRTIAFQLYGSVLLSGATLVIGASAMLLLDLYTARIAIETRFAAFTLLLMVCCVHLVLILRRLQPVAGGRVLGTGVIMSTGSRFMFNSVINMALMRVDLLLLGILATEEAVGLYRVAAEGGLLVAFGYTAVTTVLAPEYARIHSVGDRERLQKTVRHATWLILLIGGVIALPLIFGSHLFIAVVFGESYVPASLALSIIAAGYLVSFLFGDPVYILNMTGHHDRVTLLVAISLALSLLLCLILIPPLGGTGAAIAASVALICYRYLACRAVFQRLGVNCAIFGKLTTLGTAPDRVA
ncbi:oligosaccharide flippase family protein [Sphingopyxis sp. XHP0097]|uniref:Oligosaccharide flippase family protein n=1 Tax=Sphingopyxis jiangsuensis TaxID=2871171 RepID=A0ABS7MAT7_9SPHN|nr:oligosaccharide flippase family protein [Sphingopyxis jiangsuensis]MBY4636073.1 oligosaccharide flippase family protein [Sphingopyxis jiangsuensis]